MDEVTVSRELLEAFVDDSECWFDHHGGCQQHGYLSLRPEQLCPQEEVKQILTATVVAPRKSAAI